MIIVVLVVGSVRGKTKQRILTYGNTLTNIFLSYISLLNVPFPCRRSFCDSHCGCGVSAHKHHNVFIHDTLVIYVHDAVTPFFAHHGAFRSIPGPWITSWIRRLKRPVLASVPGEGIDR